ncbi:MAG: class IV adenylate cyclase [Candidatus Eisenbacteria bacterium]|uniref:Class IV adenylate cyclase n=1 Tax=Eiseniibacteriota bacterium TaxID=2212470 RepID=A0A948S0G4_UNCEI|nr:class IV adenylate cyclase [Candidatus Eisenbacteria bacterium]MBU1947438.1 class IV adenylate cyclase [Candidatus Eisenbacteria bacterium]MBU2693316.1 class IV adenylate cyclase [Candidatus Eisenbacteria bacterium]
MARNVEIKARCVDPARCRQLAERFSDKGPEILSQVDTFFYCNEGRLKLREFEDGTGELIHYHRDDDTAPSESRYVITPIGKPNLLKEALSRALGVRAIVKKRREVYISGRTRIHIDEVESLGTFVELEVVLIDDELQTSGMEDAYQLMKVLEIHKDDLLDGSYVDLLEETSGFGD